MCTLPHYLCLRRPAPILCAGTPLFGSYWVCSLDEPLALRPLMSVGGRDTWKDVVGQLRWRPRKRAWDSEGIRPIPVLQGYIRSPGVYYLLGRE